MGLGNGFLTRRKMGLRQTTKNRYREQENGAAVQRSCNTMTVASKISCIAFQRLEDTSYHLFQKPGIPVGLTAFQRK